MRLYNVVAKSNSVHENLHDFVHVNVHASWVFPDSC